MSADDAKLWERVWKLEALAKGTNYPAEARAARKKARSLRKTLGPEPIRMATKPAVVWHEPEPTPEEEHEWPWEWGWWVIEDPMSRG